jgi:uncharacterized protein YqeY
MSVVKAIQADSVSAIKAGESEKRLMLSTLLADLQIDGKWPSLEEEEEALIRLASRYERAINEGAALEPYLEYLTPLLPKMLTTEELRALVNEHKFKSMGAAMGWFKQHPEAGLFKPLMLKEVLAE